MDDGESCAVSVCEQLEASDFWGWLPLKQKRIVTEMVSWWFVGWWLGMSSGWCQPFQAFFPMLSNAFRVLTKEGSIYIVKFPEIF